MNIRAMTPTRLVLALATAGLVGGAGATLMSGSQALAQAPGTVATAPAAAATTVVGAPDFSQIAQRYGSAVVNISVSGMRSVSNVPVQIG